MRIVLGKAPGTKMGEGMEYGTSFGVCGEKIPADYALTLTLGGCYCAVSSMAPGGTLPKNMSTDVEEWLLWQAPGIGKEEKEKAWHSL